ncbi:MAG: hypothetical protein HY686_04700 [Chloroflexi bacterium]|nr:hypothetical protein [Chloroflexota bacterium]
MGLTHVQQQLLQGAREAAKELGGKVRELTALIGELSACEKLNLTWEPSDRYDARADRTLYQVKTRHSESTPKVNPAGRLGRFGRKKGYPFDVGLYVELDEEFNVAGIWKMEVEKLKDLEGAGSGKRALHVHTFVKHADAMVIV